MSKLFNLDRSDPVGRAFQRYLDNLKIVGAVVAMLAIGSLLAGVPHVQIGETTYRQQSANDGPSASYVSVTGFKYVEAGQYGPPGCPMILFIPIWDCID